MTDYTAIRRCIEQVRRARDGRGPWQAERALYRRLLPNTTPTIARMTAQAARAVGEAIARAA